MANFLQKFQFIKPLELKREKMDINAHLPNVLIVDDEIGPRESLRMILKPNYNVYCAEDGYCRPSNPQGDRNGCHYPGS